MHPTGADPLSEPVVTPARPASPRTRAPIGARAVAAAAVTADCLSPELVRGLVTGLVTWQLADARAGTRELLDLHRASLEREDGAWARLLERGAARGLLPHALATERVPDRAATQALTALLGRPSTDAAHDDADEEALGDAHEALLGASRRDTGSHYTPRALTTQVVATTLRPVLAALGPKAPPEALLSITLCDPAMGSGAFLLEACRQLAERVFAARCELGLELPTSARGLRRARRDVATACLIGVDKDDEAAHLSRLSLWLMTSDDLGRPPAPELAPLSLYVGDALIGLDPSRPGVLPTTEPDPDPVVAALWERVHAGEVPSEHVVAVADAFVHAWFDSEDKRERKAALDETRSRVRKWRASGALEVPGRLSRAARRAAERLRPFHWTVAVGPRHIDAFMGNPPFLGGKRISTVLGGPYASWLAKLHQASKNADLAAHFFRRAATLLAPRGTIGLIATNTIAQGDTRTVGLSHLLANDFTVYAATRSQRWVGAANVSVSVVHLSRGLPTSAPRSLDGRPVTAVDSRLRARPERADPAALEENRDRAFVGCFLRGDGFVVSSAVRNQLLKAQPEGARFIRPYLGGEEVNTSPTQAYHRYVIDFSDCSLEEAEAYPALVDTLRLRVKPSRDRLRNDGADLAHKRAWWRFANTRPELRRAIAPLSRCIVAARVTKHLCFAFQPTDRVFSEQLLVFAFDDFEHFAVLESRVHEAWARLMSSSLGEGLRYTPSEAFETFPFPLPVAGGVGSPLRRVLAELGRRLHDARAAYLVATELGLTAMRNRVRDPFSSDPRARTLRALYEELDRAVLAAYGWADIAVPPYIEARCQVDREDRETFEDTVVTRLYALNSERHRLATYKA